MEKPTHPTAFTIRNPMAVTVLIFMFMFSIPMVCGMFMNYQSAAGYVSPLLLLLLTGWLYKKEGHSLNALGLNFKPLTFSLLPLGIIIGVLFSTTLLLLQAASNGFHFTLNRSANLWLVVGGLFVMLQGVINEELIFRGYCFKKTVAHFGVFKANLLFAFLFLVWHWIAFNAWGNFALMLGLITTCFGHLMFSTALLRSGTLYLPIGIHWGNNWAGRFLFATGMEGPLSNKPMNNALFFISDVPKEIPGWHIFFNYSITICCMLGFTWLIWKFFRQRNNANSIVIP